MFSAHNSFNSNNYQLLQIHLFLPFKHIYSFVLLKHNTLVFTTRKNGSWCQTMTQKDGITRILLRIFIASRFFFITNVTVLPHNTYIVIRKSQKSWSSMVSEINKYMILGTTVKRKQQTNFSNPSNLIFTTINTVCLSMPRHVKN